MPTHDLNELAGIDAVLQELDTGEIVVAYNERDNDQPPTIWICETDEGRQFRIVSHDIHAALAAAEYIHAQQNEGDEGHFTKAIDTATLIDAATTTRMED